MFWTTAAFAVIATVPTGRTIDFSDKPPVLAEGKLTKQGRDTILSGLRQVRAAEQATLEVCVGEDQALSRQAGGWLARLLAAEGEKLTGIELPWVVRVRSKEECPNSVLLSLSPPIRSLEIIARVLSSTGPVNAKLKDGRTLALYADSIVPAGATLKVDTGSCQLLLSDGSHVSLGAKTELSFDRVTHRRKKRDVSVRLFVGEIWARVTEAIGPSKWVVHTGNASAGVRGTEFVVVSAAPVEGRKEPTTSVDVYDGSVQLAPRRGKSIVIGTGQRGVVTGGGKPELAELLAAPHQLRPISGSHDSPVELTWKPGADESATYRVQLAGDVEFNRIAVDRQTNAPRLEVEVPAGWYFWRVIALSPDGGRSFPSQLFKIYVE